MTNRIDEKGKITDWLANQLGGAKDISLMALGSSEAEGRLILRKITSHLIKDWKRHAGMAKHAGKPINSNDPSLNDICDFLYQSYGVDLSADYIKAIADGKVMPDAEDMQDAKDEAADGQDGGSGGDDDQDYTDREIEPVEAGEEVNTQAVADELKDIMRNGSEEQVKAALSRITDNLGNKEFVKALKSVSSDIDRATVKHNLTNVAANGGNTSPKRIHDDPRKAALHKAMNDEISNNFESLIMGSSAMLVEAGGNLSLIQIFTKIGYALYTAGMINLKIGDKDHRSKGTQRATGDASADDIHAGVVNDDYEIADSGFYIDINEMNELLSRFEIGRGDMAQIASMVRGSRVGDIIDQMSRSQRAKFVKIGGAFSMALKKSATGITAQENMSGNSNTVDFGLFKEQLAKAKIPVKDIQNAIKQLKEAAKDGDIDEVEIKQLLGDDLQSDTTSAIVAIVKCICGAIRRVEKQKPEQQPEEV